MRHGKKDNHLSRTHSHREAMLSNMAVSLILHKRIETTVAKAKVLRKYVEPILTRAKEDNNQNRKVVFQYLNHKEGMKELFGVVADKISTRPGGYTRIIKLGNRAGDSAQTAMIELVDFNETLLAAAEEKATTRTRRGRRGGAGRKAEGTASDATVTDVVAAPVVEAAPTEPAAEAAPVEAAAENVAPTTAGDDLTIIEGIGPKIAELMNNAGITTFAQLAAADDAATQQMLADAGSRFNTADATTWNEQAALARDGKMDELKALQDRLKAGKEE